MAASLGVLTLVLGGCTANSPANHERWARSQSGVDSVSSERVPAVKLFDPPTWHVTATLQPNAAVADVEKLVEAWPKRAQGSMLTVVRPAGAGPELSFTAWPRAESTQARWETFTQLHNVWPGARLSVGTDVERRESAVVGLERCDPWDELDRIDVPGMLARPHSVRLAMECDGPVRASVRLTPRSVPDAATLTDLRERSRATLAPLPSDTPWITTADAPQRAIRVEVTTPDIPAEPSREVLAQQRADLEVVSSSAGRSIDVKVTGEHDLRAVARETIALPAVEGLEVDSRQREVHAWADLHRLEDVTPLAARHPDLTWWVTQSGDQPDWVRASGAEFAERTRHYAVLRDSGIPWRSVVLHGNFGEPAINLELDDPGDWRPVVEAIRAVGWQGDVHLQIGTQYPGVAFTSTATGPARDAEVAHNLRPPDPERHPELIAIIKAWDATAE
ncbi:MAG TPA: hypothetical protein GXZ30_01670 [Propionibacterium sp.]|nr:hypothetical protein [Propionibacterium sp.]